MGKVDRTHGEMTFLTDIGQKAVVNRQDLKAERQNRKLAELGAEMSPGKNLNYMGSAAVHIYYNETLQYLALISQAQPLVLYNCPEILAQKAFDDLLGTMKEAYGKKRSKLRSGF